MIDKLASLTPLLRSIICDKATEYPRAGTHMGEISGSYLCRRCGWALFKGSDQFQAGCGWPSFDDAVLGHVKQQADSDGFRVEIVCQRCAGHLGHIFLHEGYTYKNQRFCVNAAAMDFILTDHVEDSEEIIIAGGCFWGVEHHMQLLAGVVKTEVGYIGGALPHPCYEDVCAGDSGHYEAVRVLYDPNTIDCHNVLRRFFEIHDPTQVMQQGFDVGPQYHSAIFYYNDVQLQIVNQLILQLTQRGYHVSTHVKPMQVFWPAEPYHQAYYAKNPQAAGCHAAVRRFD